MRNHPNWIASKRCSKQVKSQVSQYILFQLILITVSRYFHLICTIWFLINQFDLVELELLRENTILSPFSIKRVQNIPLLIKLRTILISEDANPVPAVMLIKDIVADKKMNV